MKKNLKFVLLQLLILVGYLVAEGAAHGETGKLIKASVPKLDGGSLEFAIPKTLRPNVAPNFFTLTTDLPGFPDETNSGTRVRSVFLIVRTRPKFGTLALDILSGRKANLKEMPAQHGCRVFIETVPGNSTPTVHYLFNDEHGNPVAVSDPGDWSRSYNWEHAYDEGYEIKAVVDKKYGTQFQKIDIKLINFVNSIMLR